MDGQPKDPVTSATQRPKERERAMAVRLAAGTDRWPIYYAASRISRTTPPFYLGAPSKKKEARNGRPLSIMAAGKNTHMDKDLLAKVLYGAKAVAVIIGPA